jgi:hypothetical protein
MVLSYVVGLVEGVLGIVRFARELNAQNPPTSQRSYGVVMLKDIIN